ncbi:SIS domain-containing protein [Halalkalibacter akibai]|uniref:SIS domain-containing protein n=1 Tax=Halalkalibacter akibai (strain ATCC 43226 / DSM 21942 / CIP 109018 / JCM 9157 / 1139) TaxID=1236973 RepID=W4QSC4_HALA3|nr:SIS domain-containing protein [Halalkalibacter akibai]GAE35010.1 hypothetical protein JCM9157_2102 [Halalkalibacter akibai JCM 9157]
MIKTYLARIQEYLAKLEKEEETTIGIAASKVAESIKQGGIIHVFGCGHSHLLGEEIFYRAGGLAPVNPIFVEELMLHQSATQASLLERKQTYAMTFLKDQDMRPEDVLIVVSTSGINPVPIETALYGKEQGVFTIGITSKDYSVNQPSRYPSGEYLYDVVDVTINNHAKAGDGVLTLSDGVAYGPSSSIVGLAIINSIMVGAIEKLVELDYEPPVFKSGNIAGSDEHNQRLIERYKDRIRF